MNTSRSITTNKQAATIDFLCFNDETVPGASISLDMLIIACGRGSVKYIVACGT